MKMKNLIALLLAVLLTLSLCSCSIADLFGNSEPEVIAGKDGANGKDGKGVVSINLTSSEGGVDTYTILFTDNTTSTFTVTNGNNGRDIVKTEIIEGYLWVTYSDAPTEPVNVGCVSTEFSGTYGLVYYPLPDGTYAVSVGTALYLEEITVPAKFNGKTISTIMDNAFENLSNLKSISLPNTVTSIGNNAFAGCAKLETVNFPTSLTTIGANAFDGCAELLTIQIPASVITIGDYAFANCTKLTSVTLSPSLVTIGEKVFDNVTSVKSATVPANALSVLPKTVVALTVNGGYDIPSEGYKGSKIQSLTLGNGIKNIGANAFANSVYLSSVTFNEGLKTIGENAFEGSYSLYQITLPSTLESIETNAFLHCRKLIEICNLSSNITLELGSSSTNGGITTYAKGFISNPENSCLAYDDNGFLFYNNGTDVLLVGYEGTEKELVLPNRYNNKVYDICNYAFFDNQNFTSVTFGTGTRNIGYGAFYHCDSLKTVVLSDKTELIDDQAFYTCGKMQTVSNADNVVTVGDRAFFYDYSLTSIDIGDKLVTIKDVAFWYCYNLPSINLPATLNKIGINGFYHCAKMTTINYAGTVEQWNAINKSTNWDFEVGNGDYTIYCSDSNIVKTTPK